MRRTLLSWFAVTGLSSIAYAGPSAELYLSRPITILVRIPAGGPTDTIARIVSEQMSVFLAQPLVIEDVTGAGGTIGAGRVARAAPDGYTLCVGFLGAHVLNGAIYSLQYDVVKDFEPIALLASNPIVAKKIIPAQDLVGGHIDLTFDQPPDSLPHVRDGSIKAYVVTPNDVLRLRRTF